MAYKRLISLASLCSLTMIFISWGFFGHERINEYAIYTLPIELRSFYIENSDAIQYYATLPDKRRYAVEEEGGRHFMDMEFYFKKFPNDSSNIFKQSFSTLKEKFQDTILETGYAYWNIQEKYKHLVEAFKFRNHKQILKLSGELGHYIGDIHVPLHTTENYNGQMTGQHGIHALWETLFLKYEWDELIDYMPQAVLLNRLDSAISNTILKSHSYVPIVLKSDNKARSSLNGKVYRGNTQTYNNLDVHPKYIDLIEEVQYPILKERMEKSIHMTASIWYTAWIEAGRPSLSNEKVEIEHEEISDSLNHREHVH